MDYQVFKSIDTKMKNTQQQIFSSSLDTADKSDMLFDIFEVRKKIIGRTKNKQLMNELITKIINFFLYINTLQKPNRIYIFTGHGWNTNLQFDISKEHNLNIVMLSSQSCLLESTEYGLFDSKSILCYGSKSKAVDTWYEFNHESKKFGENKYIRFDSDVNTIVPDMLLSLHPKVTESNYFLEIGNPSLNLNSKTMLLSELVRSIPTDNAVIHISACRSALDSFQVSNIPQTFKQSDILYEAKFNKRAREKTVVNEQTTLNGGEDIIDKINKIAGLEIGKVVTDPSSEPFYV
jgi:hypothetical protein